MAERPRLKTLSTLEQCPTLLRRDVHCLWRREIVRHTDIDVNRHVTNTVIAGFFDNGRYEFLKRHVMGTVPADSGFVLATVQIDHIDELLDVESADVGTHVLRIGTSSFQTGQALFTGDRCVATAIATTVLFDRQMRRSAPMPSACVQLLSNWTASAGAIE